MTGRTATCPLYDREIETFIDLGQRIYVSHNGRTLIPCQASAWLVEDDELTTTERTPTGI